MKLSICMIIKDEEKNLERCLNSLITLREKVDSELIIVDTGSSDRSPEIAKKYTDKVYFHKWNDNFSEMRNISISYARGEWILIIDADEELISCDEIVDFLSSNKSNGYNSATIFCKNIMSDSDYNSILITSFRLFRNNGTFKYIGSVHNSPIIMEPTENLKDVLNHYGYMVTDKKLVEKKFKRTSRLLLKELEKDPINIYYRYQLSVSYHAHGDYYEALNECEKAYNAVKNNGLNSRQYFHIYHHLVKCLYSLSNFTKAKTICLEALEIESQHIDMYYYLGEVLIKLKDFDGAIKAFNNYLKLLGNYKELSIINDSMVYFEKIGYVEVVYRHLALIYYNKEDYEKVLDYITLIKSEEICRNSIYIFADSCIKLDKFDELKNYYKSITKQYKNLEIEFYGFLEDKTKKSEYSTSTKLYEIFSKKSDKHSMLNMLRLFMAQNNEIEKDIIKNYLGQLDLNDLPEYYGDILYYCIVFNFDFYSYLFNVSETNIIKYFLYLNGKNSDFSNTLRNYYNIYSDKVEFKYVRINKIINKFLMASGSYDVEKYKEIFFRYLDLGIKYVTMIYSQELIENEWASDVKNNEEVFLIYMKKASEIKDSNQIEYIKLLKKGLHVYPEMKKGIELILEDIEKATDAFNKEVDEFEQYKIQIKNVIKTLIDENKMDEAEKIISQYEEIVKDDAEIVLFKSRISLMKLSVKSSDTYKM